MHKAVNKPVLLVRTGLVLIGTRARDVASVKQWMSALGAHQDSMLTLSEKAIPDDIGRPEYYIDRYFYSKTPQLKYGFEAAPPAKNTNE